MKRFNYFLIIICTSISFHQLTAYDIPPFIDLGTTNILSGGPKIEAPGLYWFQYQNNYYANKFLDNCGCPLGGVKSPALEQVYIFTEFLYQTKLKFFGGAPGISVVLPSLAFSHITHNSLNLIATKAGLANLAINPFFQWSPINYHGRPFFIHRIGAFFNFPAITNKYPEKTINPGTRSFYIDSYWTATMYLTERLATSWRMFYLWCGENKKTKVTAGQTFHINYDLEYEVYKDCWIAINGYYLQQLKESKKDGSYIAGSKERVISVGPGFYLFLPRSYQLLGHLYFEKKARNRPQGISAFLNFIKHF
jgi:anthranilate 1,2-dioxygenase (deaminating, decarboxylating) large subunit